MKESQLGVQAFKVKIRGIKSSMSKEFRSADARGSSPREQEIVGIGIPGKCRSSKGKRPFEEEEKACTTSGTEIGAAGSCARAYANCTDAMLFELSGETAGNCAYTLHIDAGATRNSGSGDASKCTV